MKLLLSFLIFMVRNLKLLIGKFQELIYFINSYLRFNIVLPFFLWCYNLNLLSILSEIFF